MRLCLCGFCKRIARYWRRRAVQAELLSLGTRGLHDIGIAYGDIPAVANDAYLQDPTRRQRGQGDTNAAALQTTCCANSTFKACIPAEREIAMTTALTKQPREIAENWIESWNRRDLDAVLEHFSDDFEFSSPLISELAGESSGRLIGKAAVRNYWQAALARLPNLRFELVHVFSGVDCVTILYRGHRGLCAEVLQFGRNNLALRGQALYMADT